MDVATFYGNIVQMNARCTERYIQGATESWFCRQGSAAQFRHAQVQRSLGSAGQIQRSKFNGTGSAGPGSADMDLVLDQDLRNRDS